MQNIDVLDHGYIRLIETWGSDERIVEAARMSTEKGFQGWGPVHATNCPAHPDLLAWAKSITSNELRGTACTCEPKPGDEKLLRFLWEHKHHTPFEMGGMTIEVQAPIFVFREWHRHRTQSYNELSARYTPLPDLYYLPTPERLRQTSTTNKQAAAVAEAQPVEQLQWLVELEKAYQRVESLYQNGLAIGIPKEVARIIMPVGHYSRMRASANLRNWLMFLTLRMNPAAQWEIRCYANALALLIAQAFPRTYGLFVEGLK